ncbi:hypothetical protein XU18_1633 [Perkinsela sp. CCAP 1560/4]|nr:hypothetical protein XU18_1633 [Perkinsela sp. CCAP 1560/4]|eukprot:KNH07742.1 hypothetical protein XU18_1633 [Perkinsela sp. CCAP 1560/4]
MDDVLKQRASSEAVAHRHPADYEIWTDGSYIEETSSVAGAALIFKKGRALTKQSLSVERGARAFAQNAWLYMPAYVALSPTSASTVVSVS